jgi:hypothetical protein
VLGTDGCELNNDFIINGFRRFSQRGNWLSLPVAVDAALLASLFLRYNAGRERVRDAAD